MREKEKPVDPRWTNYFIQLRRKTLWQLLFWLPGSWAFFTLIGYISSVKSDSLERIAWESLVYTAGIQISLTLVFTGFWTVITIIGERGFDFISRHQVSPYIVLSLVGSGGGIFISNYVLAFQRNEPPRPSHLLLETFLVAALISVAITFYQAYSHTKTENRKLTEITIESQYSTLKNQMQPHFLFNSLNSLSELIEENPDKASLMTEKLANLYRFILANSKEKTSLLSSEIAIVQSYLDLECLRFPNRLHYTIKLDCEDNDIYLPSLMLQTLVENAVKHGISKSIDGGEIVVRVYHKPNSNLYRAEVLNGGNRLKKTANRASQTGIQNTIARLDLLYGKLHNFTLSECEDHQTKAAFNFTGEFIA